MWSLTIGIAIAALGGALLQIPAVQDGLLERALKRLVGTRPDELFQDDALRVLVCGSSSPFPSADRARPCTAIFAAGHFWVVDTGTGSWNQLALWRIPGEKIGAVLLTHFHSDHIGELGEYDLQTWVAGRPDPLRVFGPQGVERVVSGFEEAYALDAGYRIAHHGADLLPASVGRMRAQVVSGGERVLEQDGLVITAFSVSHEPVSPAVGYRFDYRGRSVAITGDTIRSENVIEAASGVDVLVHEAQANHVVARIGEAADQAGRDRIAKVMSDIPEYHTTPVEAAEVANDAGARLLVFTHLTPPPQNLLLEQIFLRGVSEVRPDGWILGEDGLLITLPAGSDRIEIGRLD